jgi:hypothetical protein
MYAFVRTWPNITYRVSLLEIYAANPIEKHYKMAKRILRYLSETTNIRIQYKKELLWNSQLTLERYVDFDWKSNLEDRRSVTGYLFCINGSPVSWNSKQQKTIALSSVEVEYIVVT